MEELSFRWFSVWYLALGILLLTSGVYILARLGPVSRYIAGTSGLEKPPATWIHTLRYLLLFTIPCLVLSFFPFSWVELLFSVWCLVIIFTAGQLLLHWRQTAEAIDRNRAQLPRKLKFAAANLFSLGLIMFLLFYRASMLAQS